MLISALPAPKTRVVTPSAVSEAGRLLLPHSVNWTGQEEALPLVTLSAVEPLSKQVPELNALGRLVPAEPFMALHCP